MQIQEGIEEGEIDNRAAQVKAKKRQIKSKKAKKRHN
jgi:hypothetical protein